MFSLMLVLFAMVPISIMFIMSLFYDYKHNDDKIAIRVISSILLFITLFLLIVVGSAVPASSVLDKTKNIQNDRSKLVILEQRQASYIALIKDQLEQYPKYEKSVIDDVVANLKQNNIAILLKFPELKANQTIAQVVQDTMKVSDSVYNLRQKILDIQTSIRKMQASPWIIKIWWPSTHDALK